MNRLKRALLFFILLVFGVILIRTAWVGDDVYITLRTVDNFVNGYGLNWNVAERVQSYTHPLWMLLMIPVYAASREAYFSALFLSFVFTVATLLIVARQPNAIIGLVILLMSKAFMDFSVSGLENPLTHFLLAIFVLQFLAKDDWNDRDILRLNLVAALATLNRMDAALFFVPALLYLFYRRFSIQTIGRTIGSMLIGFSPFIIWELFSLVYYGFPFPNTAYAKLGTGISHNALIAQGLVYYVDSFSRDPLTLIMLAVGLAMAFWKGALKERLVAAGVVLYLLYIIDIGGDFMSGRFFSAPLLVCILLLMRLLEPVAPRVKTVLAISTLLLGFLAPYPTLLVRTDQPAFSEHDIQIGINDERAFYYAKTGLLPMLETNEVSLVDRGWAEHGLALRERGKTVVDEKNVGFTGFFAGPDVFIVDAYALCDPLLARLPALEQEKWRIGHFERAIPEGYIQTLRTGENQVKPVALALYYDKLALIVRAPLWSPERLWAIWKMNTGQYNDLLNE